MAKIIVLGAGMVGRTIAGDLSKNHDVSSVDFNDENLEILRKRYGIKTIISDFSDLPSIGKLVNDFDLVIGAVPGFLGFNVVKTVIEAGKNIVDISFFPEDAFELDLLAKDKGVTAVVDCGVAPGMSNMILGYHAARMKVENFLFYVGGLPFQREFPFQYKAPFSPVDVLEEYTREARYVENGVEIFKPALSDAEYLNFPNVGTLEAFNTDGLRSIIKTIKAKNMKEKTLRYPGHIEYIKVLKEAGFFSENEVEIKGKMIKPIDFTSKILFDKWKLNDSDDEFTIMRILIDGTENGIEKKYQYDLFDLRDQMTGESSMARTTGYPCTAVANLVLDGKFTRKGICPPEYIGEIEECFRFVMNYLEKRNVIYMKS